MNFMSIFFSVLAAFWLVGAALGTGYYLSRRDRAKSSALSGIIWSLVFSWAFVGWVAGELAALALKNLVSISHNQKLRRP